MAIRYAVEGDLRFISHHDSLRLFERALVRADLPLRYSEGFNPRPRLSIALPRPVGVASGDELLVIELSEPIEPSSALTRLAPQMPLGMTLLGAEQPDDADRRLPCDACYTVSFGPELQDRIAQQATNMLAAEQLPVTREAHEAGARAKAIDIRPYIMSIEAQPQAVRWQQTISQTGTARVSEILELLGLPIAEYLHRVRREKVTYQA